MTRKHFILISNIIRAYNKSIAMGWDYNLAEAFADICESESPSFDRDKFMLACGIGEICRKCEDYNNDGIYHICPDNQ